MNHIFFAALIHNKSANTGDTTTIFYRHKRICVPSFSSVLNEGAQERMLRFVHSFIHSLRLNTSPRTVFLKSHEWKQQPEARNSLLGCFCQMCAAALEPIVPLLRIAAARSPLTPRGLSSEQPAATNTHTQAQQSGTERGSRVLTAVATGDSSMSRCGLMELMFQGARAVGSGVGIPDPISSLESIPGPLRVNDEPCERSGLERCGVSLRWSTSPSGPSSSSPCSPV